MITAIATLAALCATGVVDQRDDDVVTVLGASGVHVVAVSTIEGSPIEGDRIELDHGHCVVRAPDPLLQRRIAHRLRALRR